MFHYVIYQNPKDQPFPFVVRRWKIEAGDMTPEGKLWGVARNEVGLNHLRSDLRGMGLTRIPRFLCDDPCILEVWI